MKKKKDNQTELDYHPQYIQDGQGKTTHVVLTFDDYTHLMEDVKDLALMTTRQDDEYMSLAELESELKREGTI